MFVWCLHFIIHLENSKLFLWLFHYVKFNSGFVPGKGGLMKGKFVSGKQLDSFLKSLLCEGNLLSYDERIERLTAASQLGLLSHDDTLIYLKSINSKFRL